MLKKSLPAPIRKIWARRDSNPRPRDYESPALPLRHRPVTTKVIFNFQKSWACATASTAIAVRATYLSSNVTLSHLLVGRVPQARDDKRLFSFQKVQGLRYRLHCYAVRAAWFSIAPGCYRLSNRLTPHPYAVYCVHD